MGKFALVLKNLKSEFKRIIFPTTEIIWKHSVIVLACSIVIGLIIFCFDSVIGFGFGFLLR